MRRPGTGYTVVELLLSICVITIMAAALWRLVAPTAGASGHW